MKSFKFVDLFAGIGGFHLALKSLNGECVLASEIDKNAIKIYKENFPTTPLIGDITNSINSLPAFDVLTAGFPCQPFSKAGSRNGFEDAKNGNLFFTIIEILKKHDECKVFILENVETIKNPKYWNIIKEELEQLDFEITSTPLILSPTDFNIPQNRRRAYIIGVRKNLNKNKLTIKLPLNSNNSYQEIKENLSEKESEKFKISLTQNMVLFWWMELKKELKKWKGGRVLWADYFNNKTTDEEHYEKIKYWPKWKQAIINNSRNFYLKNQKKIDEWIKKSRILTYAPSYRKIEFYAKNFEKYNNLIVQFRPSGIRIAKKEVFPVITAGNQIPVIFTKHGYRKLTYRECANLQSFNKDFIIHNKNYMYKLLGNAVNVKVIKEIFLRLNLLKNIG